MISSCGRAWPLPGIGFLTLMLLSGLLLSGCESEQVALNPIETPAKLQAAEPRVSGAIPSDKTRLPSFEARGVASTELVTTPGAVGSGNQVVALRYASAKDLAKVLEPYVAEGGKITADPGRNVLIVSGDAAIRQTLTSMIRAFDIDVLAGQSYALFPAGDGN